LDIDYQAVQDLFSSVEQRIMGVLVDENQAAERGKLRELIGFESITALRYTLLMLARERTLQDVQRGKQKLMKMAVGANPVMDENVARLHHELAKFLKLDEEPRHRLRQWIPTSQMGNLQTMLKALESEKEYRNYTKTQAIFKRVVNKL